jgi:hypothetical protein
MLVDMKRTRGGGRMGPNGVAWHLPREDDSGSRRSRASSHTDSVADLDATTVTVAHVRKPCGAVEVLTAPFLENVLSCNFRDSDFFDKEEAYLWMCEARDVVPIPFEMMLSRRVLATLPRLETKVRGACHQWEPKLVTSKTTVTHMTHGTTSYVASCTDVKKRQRMQ